MKRAGDLEESGQFHILSKGANDTKEGQNNRVDKGRMKQPEGRSGDANDCEQPAAQTMAQPQPSTRFRTFTQQGQPLAQKVGGRQTVTAVRRKRDDRFMNEAGNQKDTQRCRLPTDDAPQRLESMIVRESMKRRIPAFAPERAQ